MGSLGLRAGPVEREIPPPAGKNAGVRDDAAETGAESALSPATTNAGYE